MSARALGWILALVCSLPVAASAEGTGEPSFPCLGRWQGVGSNTGIASTWTIDMNVTAPSPEGRCGTIEYTHPTCGGGMLDCRVENGLVHVREHYTHDDGNCAPPARLEFSCEGDQMRWAWVGWEVARSTLTRVGPPPAPPTPALPVPAPAPAIAQVPLQPAPAETTRDEDPPFGCGCSAPRSRRGRPAPAVLALVALAWGRRSARART